MTDRPSEQEALGEGAGKGSRMGSPDAGFWSDMDARWPSEQEAVAIAEVARAIYYKAMDEQSTIRWSVAYQLAEAAIAALDSHRAPPAGQRDINNDH